jgi:hypothetical protein
MLGALRWGDPRGAAPGGPLHQYGRDRIVQLGTDSSPMVLIPQQALEPMADCDAHGRHPPVLISFSTEQALRACAVVTGPKSQDVPSAVDANADRTIGRRFVTYLSCASMWIPSMALLGKPGQGGGSATLSSRRGLFRLSTRPCLWPP